MTDQAKPETPVEIPGTKLRMWYDSYNEQFKVNDGKGELVGIGDGIGHAMAQAFDAAGLEYAVIPLTLVRKYRAIWYDLNQRSVRVEKESTERELAMLFADLLRVADHATP